MKKFAILVSGNGTNLQALLDAISKNNLDIKIPIVVSNVAGVKALKRAENANIKTIVLEKKTNEKRFEYDKRLTEILLPFNIDYVFLLGWMRILTENFIKYFKIVNLHPALPNTFVGTNCIEKQFIAFQNDEIFECGIMTHFVTDEKVDRGPVIFEKKVPCFKGENLENFEARIHEAEHNLVIKTASYISTL